MVSSIWMIVGLAMFLGTHLVGVFAPAWRQQQISRLGVNGWKGAYALVSIIGLALAIWGFGQSRLDPIWVWHPPMGLRHLVSLLMLPAFMLLVAAYIPGNHLRAHLGHPMVLSVKLWAFSHLLANGRLGDIIFFAAFLVWAIILFAKLRRRDRANPPPVKPVKWSATITTVVLGGVLWAVFALHLHVYVTGVPVFAR